MKRTPWDTSYDRVLSLRQMAATRSITANDKRAMRNLKLVGSASHGALTTSLAAVKL